MPYGPHLGLWRTSVRGAASPHPFADMAAPSSADRPRAGRAGAAAGEVAIQKPKTRLTVTLRLLAFAD
jgi:hypothetical protein